MSLGEFFDDIAPGDELEDVAGSLDGVVRSMQRNNELLATLVQGQGNVELPEQIEPIPFSYSSVHPGGGSLDVPSGVTTIDFANGQVKNENEGIILDDGELASISDVSRQYDTVEAAFRSFVIQVDSPVDAWIPGNPKVVLAAGETYHINDVNFTEVKLDGSLPFSFIMMASTRSNPPRIDTSVPIQSRDGNLDSGTHDSFVRMDWQPFDLNNSDRIGDFTEANPVIDTHRMDRSTVIVENASGSANDIDVQVRGRAHSDGTFRELDRSDNVSQNDHVIFDIAENISQIDVRVQNSANGNTVAAEGEYSGGGS